MGDAAALAEVLQRLVTPAPLREWMPLDAEAKARGKTTSALREWCERNVRTLGRFIWDYHPLGRKHAPGYGFLPRRSRCYCARDRRHSVCDHCANELRKAWKSPSWAEVEK
jgi:hypothetical protein